MRRLLKMLFCIVWRKFKYCFIYLSTVLFIYVIFIRLIGLNAEKPKTSVNLRYVTVHIDLKGSPPKITYLVSLLPILSIYGVNALLMEYEDMFPYVDSIANISSANAYKRTELLMFINTAKNLKMEIIPLIQTFGHMEFVLKLKQFAHLREQQKSYKDICPSNPESRKLITTMLKQVIDLHAIIYPLQHIHVGCDEVRKLNECPKCKKRQMKSTDLFIDHVKEVSSIVKELSPSLKILMWDDMLSQPGVPETYLLHNVEAVSWQYRAKPIFSHKNFYNLHKNFKNIWIATAFKGADGNNATIPNIRTRFQNHLSWMKFILGYKFGGEKKVYNFEGIILTGWSRYTHMAPQCELLPIAMPSLVLNLLLIKTVQDGIDQGDLDLYYCDFFNKYLFKEFNEIFENHGHTGKKCAFENTYLYVEHDKLFNRKLQIDCLRNLDESKSQCHSVKTYMNLESTFAQCEKALENLMNRKKNLQNFMVKYYKNFVIDSYIHDTVNVPAKKISKLMRYVQNCTKSVKKRRN